MGKNGSWISLSGQPETSVLLTRWVLVIGISYMLLYASSGELAPLWPHQMLVGALVFSNLHLRFWLSRGADWKKLRWGYMLGDIFVVLLVVSLLESDSTPLYTVYFATLLAAFVLPRMGAIAALAVLGSLVYGSVLYKELGPSMFRDQPSTTI